MRVYAYVNKKGDWSAFTGLREELFVEGHVYTRDYEFIETERARRGKDNEGFNLKAYAGVTELNKTRGEAKNQKMFNRIVDLDGEFDSLGSNEVTSNSLYLAEKTDDFDILVDDIAFNQAVERLFSLRDEVAIEYGVDLIQCVKSALENVGNAQESLKNLVKGNKELAGVVQDVLLSATQNRLVSRLSLV